MKPIIFKLFLWLIASAAIAGTVYIGFSKYIDLLEDLEESSEAAEIEGRYEQEFLMTKDPKTNTVPRERLLKAYETAQLLRLEKAGDALPIYWMERGPDNVGGRTRALLIDANDPSGQTVWAAGVSGGLWRTTNIDADPPSWISIDDFFDNLAITTITQAPNEPNVMYFGTGERGLQPNGLGYISGVRGMGIWRSVDGGSTWTHLTSTISNSMMNFGEVNKIEIANNGWVYAATSNGLRRSIDNGVSWPVIRQNGSNVQDIEIAPNGDVYIGVQGDAIHRLRNSTWETINSGDDTDIPSSNLGRIEIAIAPNNPRVIYAAYENNSNVKETDGTCQAILQSTDGGDTWEQKTVPAGLGGICWYAFIMAVDPNNTERIWIGSLRLFESDDSGDSWNQLNGNLHADQHAIVYRAGSSDEMVFGNDGGVYRCTDGSGTNPTLTPKNKTYNITQFYSAALHPDAGSNYMLGGTQDNGTRRFRNPDLNDTDEPTESDGGFCFIDQDNSNIQITGSQNRQFYLSTDGGNTLPFPVVIPEIEDVLFITPADYDDDADILYASDVSNTYSRLTDIGGGNDLTNITVANFNDDKVSAVKVSPNNSNRVYFGLINGPVILVDNANTGNNKTGAIVLDTIAAYVSSIDVEVGNEDHILVTYSNFGMPSVWETTDGGDNWYNIEGNLPDMPVRWVVFNPLNTDQALIATDLGVWSASNLDGSNTKWYPTNYFGLANVRVDMLQFRESDHLLAAATHGRGVYTTDYFSLFGTCNPDLAITGNIPSGVYFVENEIEADGTVQENEKVIFRAGKEILLTDGFTVEEGADFWGIILPCTPGNGRRNSLVLSKTSEENPLSSFNFKFYPNPTVNDATIEYKLERSDVVSLEVRDIRGIMVAKLIDNRIQMSGIHTVNFDTSNLKSGVYLITFRIKSKSITEKIVVAGS